MRSHLRRDCVSQNTHSKSLPLLRRARLAVTASQAAPTTLLASPGHQQAPLPRAGGTRLPETPAFKQNTLKSDKGRKDFLTGTQLSGSEQGKKIGSALHSQGTARIGDAEIPQHKV